MSVSDTGGSNDANPTPPASVDKSEIASAPAETKPKSPRPKIGDSRPAPAASKESSSGDDSKPGEGTSNSARRRRRRRRNSGGASRPDGADSSTAQSGNGQSSKRQNDGGSRGAKKSQAPQPVRHVVASAPVELDENQLKRRRGRSRKGRPVGRYMMVVSRRSDATHIAIMEGRHLIEYYVSRPSDDVAQIHGNIYVGKVQNVLPGMEAAFVDIGTPKNAVLYRGDVLYDKSAQPKGAERPKIEQLLKPKQTVVCQVTKNPIAHKGARLTTEVSLPGRFVVLVPNSDTYGISKRLPDNERKRLRQILDKAKPKQHGVIVRTAAENVTAEEIARDVAGLVQQWEQIEALAAKAKGAQLLYREPDMSTRVIREEFNKDYRAVVIDDRALHDEIADYVSVITPALADRVEFYDPEVEGLPIMGRFHVHEQLHKALDRKVWLPSGGSLIIEATEALTVIDVNTGKNVGSSSLEETVFRNNLEAAEEVARQLRLRDIGGIIVIDFVDMEDKKNRDETMRVFREALSRDKTRTQVFEISELGLAEMTRKRIGEGLLESLSDRCPHCDGRGLVIHEPAENS
jgi:ribonuclease E